MMICWGKRDSLEQQDEANHEEQNQNEDAQEKRSENRVNIVGVYICHIRFCLQRHTVIISPGMARASTLPCKLATDVWSLGLVKSRGKIDDAPRSLPAERS